MRAIIVHHGLSEIDGNFDEVLTETGRQQMAGLGHKIKESVGSSRVALLTSTAPCACQSAYILGQILGAELEESLLLLQIGRRSSRSSLRSILYLIQEAQGKADVVVVVTHAMYARYLPRCIAQEICQLDEVGVSSFPNKAIGPGEAWSIELQLHTCTHITPQ